jgi:Prokaryotic E2 family E/Multiubiquitin
MSSESEKHDQQHDDKTEKGHINISIDDKKYRAPKEVMTGTELRHLAQPPIAADRDLFEEVAGPADDKKIADEERVQLKSGMRFYSAPRTINPGDVPHLPELDEEYLTTKGMRWSLPAAGFLLLEGIALAADKYDRSTVDLLIRVPGGYPTAALDMFYVSPELKLKGGGFPPAAEVFEDHLGRRWQRFSRHMNSGACLWRPGVDSLKTFLALVFGELQGKR